MKNYELTTLPYPVEHGYRNRTTFILDRPLAIHTVAEGERFIPSGTEVTLIHCDHSYLCRIHLDTCDTKGRSFARHLFECT
jgi:hypothetical protein